MEAFTYLYPLANHSLIRRMERPKLLRDLDAFGYALRARRLSAARFLRISASSNEKTYCRSLPNFVYRSKGSNARWSPASLVGISVVSLRNDAHGKSAGELARQAFGPFGSAGGHRTMDKAVIPPATLEQQLGRLSDAELVPFVQNQLLQYLGILVSV